tara:strand:- start:7076 stop:7384 length:309 start_codon:yes stop_codon:yes gene_type:complete
MEGSFYDMSELDIKQLRFIRIKSLAWALEGFREGTIRRNTIVELIPYSSLKSLLFELESEELYEDCLVVFTLMNEIYKENEKRNENANSPFNQTNRGMEDRG